MEDLSSDDITEFAQRLRGHRDQLRAHIRDKLLEARREDYAEIAGHVFDAGEESVAELVASANLSHLEREASELGDVEAALQRIRAGAYGICIDCGREIDRERLDANPTAKRCIDDQRRYEQRYAGGRDVTPSL